MGINAQCNLQPTIEGQLVLCHYDSTTDLSTQNYDSYQWYAFIGNDTVATAIAGATEQTLVLEGTGEVNSDYFVEVSSDTCMEYSDTVTVEQVFYNVSAITRSNNIFFENGNFTLCEEDTGSIHYN